MVAFMALAFAGRMGGGCLRMAARRGSEQCLQAIRFRNRNIVIDITPRNRRGAGVAATGDYGIVSSGRSQRDFS